MTEVQITKGRVTIDHMTGVEVEVVIDRMIDHFAQGDMIGEAEEDMLPEEIEEGMIGVEGDTIEAIRVVMIEVEEEDTIEVAIEAILEVMLQEETAGIQEDMIEDTVEVVMSQEEVGIEVAMSQEVVDIEVEEDMMEVPEITLLREAAVTIDQEIILDLEDILVTDHGMMIEDHHLVATQEEAIREAAGTDLEMTIVEDIHHDEIILHQIAMKAEVHPQALRRTAHQVDIAVAHL